MEREQAVGKFDTGWRLSGTCSTVALGAIKTPMHKIEAHDFLKSLQPIGRMGKIDEVVDAVMYLNDAKFVTGEVLHVDGGAHAGKW